MKFNGYFDWMYENELAAPISYGCVMLFADIPNWDKHLARIDVEDIYGVPGKALEHHPHVSLIYGLHINKVDPKEIKELMETFFPIKVSIKTISMFETSDCDVVKYDVPKSKEIKTWRDELLKFPNTQEFDKYEPHITLSYVKKGTAFKYIRKFEEPFHVIFNRAEYSYTDNEKDNIVVQLDKV